MIMRDYYMPETPITDAMAVTNADRIRNWNDHELAETIANFVSEIDNGDVRYSDDPNDWLEWLKQPAEEETQQDCTYNKNGHCMGQKLMPECDAKNCDRKKH
jgi:hypothetical protein